MLERRTIQQWADWENLTVLDYDGFDRYDPHIHEKLITKAEYNKGIIFCTVEEKRDE